MFFLLSLFFFFLLFCYYQSFFNCLFFFKFLFLLLTILELIKLLCECIESLLKFCSSLSFKLCLNFSHFLFFCQSCWWIWNLSCLWNSFILYNLDSLIFYKLFRRWKCNWCLCLQDFWIFKIISVFTYDDLYFCIISFTNSLLQCWLNWIYNSLDFESHFFRWFWFFPIWITNHHFYHLIIIFLWRALYTTYLNLSNCYICLNWLILLSKHSSDSLLDYIFNFQYFFFFLLLIFIFFYSNWLILLNISLLSNLSIIFLIS